MIKDSNYVTVAKRDFLIEPVSRCLCVWLCSCLCISTLLSTEANDLCDVMTDKKEYYAGFLNKNVDEIEHPPGFEYTVLLLVLLPLLVLLILLGLGKSQ